jgi:hypothetical protein
LSSATANLASGVARLELVPQPGDLVADVAGQPAAQPVDRRSLVRRLVAHALALLERRHVAAQRLDEVVHDHHPERAVDVDRRGEPPGQHDREQAHHPAVLGDALAPAVRQPAMAQLTLEGLRDRDEAQERGDL